VLKSNGKWTWWTDGKFSLSWSKLREFAKEEGLYNQKSDKTFLTLPSLRISDLIDGKYPDGGGNLWITNMVKHIEHWSQYRSTFAPPAPSYIAVGRKQNPELRNYGPDTQLEKE